MNNNEIDFLLYLTANTIRLENIDAILDDFDSILEEINKRIEDVLTKVELDSGKYTKISSLVQILTSYKNALHNIETDITSEHVKIKPALLENEEHAHYKELYNKVKEKLTKYSTAINAQHFKCDEYLHPNHTPDLD